jgi:putative transposase
VERLLVLLRREGWELGKKRCYRLYTEEGLALATETTLASRNGGPPRAATPRDGPQ